MGTLRYPFLQLFLAHIQCMERRAISMDMKRLWAEVMPTENTNQIGNPVAYGCCGTCSGSHQHQKERRLKVAKWKKRWEGGRSSEREQVN
eukprot:scaffold221_cov351-Pavlova_lutheri.AAC.21